MTGSGSAVFGLFDKLETAMDACETLRSVWPETSLAMNANSEED